MKKIKQLKNLFNFYKIDGYFVPKNDEFFGEYVPKNKDNLKFISDFTGSYGFALILKKRIIYLQMDVTLCKVKSKAVSCLKLYLYQKNFHQIY